jgi:hypothetical protein
MFLCPQHALCMSLQLVMESRPLMCGLRAVLLQTIGFTLRSHLESASAESASGLAPLLPGIMEVLAGLIEDALPAAAAPLAAAAGPVLDVRAMDRALQALYRECSSGSRGGRSSPSKAAAAGAAAGKGAAAGTDAGS